MQFSFTYRSPVTAQSLIDDVRLALAKALWPKKLKAGDLFTVVRWKNVDGTTGYDRSWVGDTMRCDEVDGDRIKMSQYSEHSHDWRALSSWYTFDKIEVKLLGPNLHVSEQEKQELQSKLPERPHRPSIFRYSGY